MCGYRLQAKPAPVAAGSGAAGAAVHPQASSQPAARPRHADPSPAIGKPAAAGTPKQAPRPQKIRPKSSDDIYIGQTLNNRFKVESKIGEGGFGAVYRGVQLATGRKVALKLLHPEMTKDENLVARFRREGMVLCNLRDAHTITTYDFDQTPDGTLYIAMELLEGKSLHQLFHEQAPLDWKRMFKILTEMCSSLAEAHAQGIVHRDLKPENVYLESRPGNPEFVKILDFGIAKVMRGDAIDPQSPQLTATGQTLGTLEYMSPEQLMGKPLDGRSDVYALGVVAYEMITGRLPFPDAKGPAGLITAQLKQTPIPPSQANAKAAIPAAADRVILKCLEKDKNNRHADVTHMANALQEVLAQASSDHPVLTASGIGQRQPVVMPGPQELLETRRGDPPPMAAPPMMPQAPNGPAYDRQNLPTDRGPYDRMNQSGDRHGDHRSATPPGGAPLNPHGFAQPAAAMQGSSPSHQPLHMQPQPIPSVSPMPGSYGYQPHPGAFAARPSSKKWVWWVVALLALGAAVGAVLAVVFG